MAALNFPNSPSLNDTHTENGVTFKWNGAAWDRLGDIGAQGSAGAQGAAGAQGDTGSTGAQGATGPVAGSSSQVVYKDGSNNPSGSSSFTFDGTNLTVGGNVSIGGTLTYEDVTNIDSVGIITARAGVHVTGGNVGINTTVPAEKLDVLGTIRASAGTNQYMHMYPVAGAGYFDVKNSTTYPAIIFRQMGSGGTEERLRITSDGKIGIGIANPTLTAHIYSTAAADAALIESTQNFATLRFKSALNSSGPTIGIDGAGGLQLDQKDTSKYISFSIGSERLRITSAGDIGINATVPQQKLDVVGLAHTVAVFRPDASTTSAYGDASVVNNLINLRMPYGSNPGSANNNGARWGIKFQGRNDGAEYGTDSSKSASIYAVSEDVSAGYNRQVGLVFYTSGFDANQTERLRITSDGKMGVGCTPEVDFQVRNANGGTLKIGGSGTGATGFQIQYNNSGNTTTEILTNYRATSGNASLKLDTGTFLVATGTSGTERLRITSGGDVNILGGILNLGTADVSSGHINSYELMTFNIDTDNDDSNRYFAWFANSGSASGNERMRLTEGGELGINVTPAANDGATYNNWSVPKLHVKGNSDANKFHLVGRFVGGTDADATGAQIVIHHENDRGMALQGGRSSGNRSYGAIKSLDNLARESNVMVFTGGTGQGVENIKFYTNGGSTGTNERMSINTHGTVHTGGSTEITQTSLTPDLITRAGVMSPLFWRPFGGLTSAPSTSGPGYVDIQSGGNRHNLTDPHLGAGLGGAQFQGGLINNYGQTFSNTASGTTRESIEWNRFRILFRGVCPGSGYSVSTVKFRYSTYFYSNGWQDHAGTEWTYTGTESVRGGRWVVGPWINPSTYFTNWADVPGFALYYDDNGTGRNFRIAGGVYYQYAYFQ